jgi:hypothetical protein
MKTRMEPDILSCVEAYVLTFKADRRKVWEEKAQTGCFVACSDSKQLDGMATGVRQSRY